MIVDWETCLSGYCSHAHTLTISCYIQKRPQLFKSFVSDFQHLILTYFSHTSGNGTITIIILSSCIVTSLFLNTGISYISRLLRLHHRPLYRAHTEVSRRICADILSARRTNKLQPHYIICNLQK